LCKKKITRKAQPVLRRLLELSKKARDILGNSLTTFGQFPFPHRFLASPNKPTSQRLFDDLFYPALD
jgi:hypothetical protein